MTDYLKKIFISWTNSSGNVNSTDELINWIEALNKSTYVNISECSINSSNFWFYDDYTGEVLNRKSSFFSIKGLRCFENEHFVSEQPIIIQPEIGYLGIICREINGVLNFLMQAKIEPGNINCVQISPTIQATKSNFTRAHGGKLPKYFDLFENSDKYDVIYDQIQSEQSARFYKKRNRNMIMVVDEDFEIFPNFKWMTLGQIKKLMEIDNLVNMDTRTVLSGLPLITYFLQSTSYSNEMETFSRSITSTTLHNSIIHANLPEQIPAVFQKINNYKMFNDKKRIMIPLNQLVDWNVDEYGITCKKDADFLVRYYDIEIAGREVQQWTQPLFKANGMATFGLFCRDYENKKQFLVKLKSEIGSFDKIELGPTVQWEPTHSINTEDDIEKLFRAKLMEKKDIEINVILSEEGGRFYHEQNKNIVINLQTESLVPLPKDYIWLDYGTLNFLVQQNNCLNIQLRNLLSLLKI